jgi:phytoene dehydrogenase-like protein
LKHAADKTVHRALHDFGFSPTIVNRLLRPFLSGVLGEEELASSARYFHLLWRCFVRGRQALPEAGIQAIAEQLAETLPPDALRLNTRVESVSPDGVTVATGGREPAAAVVVATDPSTAHKLLPGLPVPQLRPISTVYYATEDPPEREPILLLDGERGSPVANTIVISAAAPSYAPAGTALIAASAVGAAAASDELEPALRTRLSTLYGADTRRWEHLATYRIGEALPAFEPGRSLRQPVRVASGLYICGDHRDTPSIQGALVSGKRAARAVATALMGARGSG